MALAVARIALSVERPDAVADAARAVRAEHTHVEACAGTSPSGAALWLFGGDGPDEADRRGEVDAAAFAAVALDALGAGVSALVTASCRLLSDDPPAGPVPRTAWMLPIPYAAPEQELADLDRWYEEEHIGMLLRCPAWLRVRRYAVDTAAGATWNRLVVHDVARADVLESPEVEASMRTPRRLALAARPWFLAGGRRPLQRY